MAGTEPKPTAAAEPTTIAAVKIVAERIIVLRFMAYLPFLSRPAYVDINVSRSAQERQVGHETQDNDPLRHNFDRRYRRRFCSGSRLWLCARHQERPPSRAAAGSGCGRQAERRCPARLHRRR